MCTLSFVHLCYFYKARTVFSTKVLKRGEEIMQSTMCSCTNLQYGRPILPMRFCKVKLEIRI